jgi:hypothetical protein
MRCLGWRGTGNEIRRKRMRCVRWRKKRRWEIKRKEKTKGGEKIGNKEKYII